MDATGRVGAPGALRLEDHQAVAARIESATERGQTVAGVDGELASELRDLVDDHPIVTGVRHEQDRALRVEVALLPTESPLRGLDVVEPSLRFDDRIEVDSKRDAVGASAIAGDGHGDLRPPPDGRCKPRGESAEEPKVRLVADWCRDGVEAEAELMAQDRRDPRYKIQVDVRGMPGLDPPNVGVGDADHRSDVASAQPRAESGAPEILAHSTEQDPGSTCPTLPGGLACRHAGKSAHRSLALAHLHLEHHEVPIGDWAKDIGPLTARFGPSAVKWNPQEVPFGGRGDDRGALLR